MTEIKKAVVLVSGGLDSATCLAWAREKGFRCYALSFSYGQRSQAELLAAKRVAKVLGAEEHRVVRLDIAQLGGSALTDHTVTLSHAAPTTDIPNTYVPARNTIFLATALAWAEVLSAKTLVIGANAVDYSQYPDCRPEFIQAFEALANVATLPIEGPYTVLAPLLSWTKAQIIQEGLRLGVDYAMTVSCYQADPEGRACGTCHSCYFRAKGFKEAHLPDPTRYTEKV